MRKLCINTVKCGMKSVRIYAIKIRELFLFWIEREREREREKEGTREG